jgi:4-hydroxy-3-polyprenylbenzoate decarboxylase
LRTHIKHLPVNRPKPRLVVGITGDVALKERRRVVLMLRETPLHTGHIRTMPTVTEMGAIVYPPVPAFYALLPEMVDHTLGRVLHLFDIDVAEVRRWTGERGRPKKREETNTQ